MRYTKMCSFCRVSQCVFIFDHHGPRRCGCALSIEGEDRRGPSTIAASPEALRRPAGAATPITSAASGPEVAPAESASRFWWTLVDAVGVMCGSHVTGQPHSVVGGASVAYPFLREDDAAQVVAEVQEAAGAEAQEAARAETHEAAPAEAWGGAQPEAPGP